MGDVQQQNNTTSAGIGAASVTVAALHSAARAANKVDSSSVSPNVVKGVLGVASFATFAAGLRSAWKHTRQPEAADLRRAQVLSGVGFASKALGVATVLTGLCPSFSLPQPYFHLIYLLDGISGSAREFYYPELFTLIRLIRIIRIQVHSSEVLIISVIITSNSLVNLFFSPART
ncbi:hypothetical protein Y032_0056g2690 [Ancylostoma ceylanicum]|uniref:Transmembrane protein 242 n=1 Tax=Ancylostoma ceylanicum TaxID=53326 RepID=A0A016U5A5_9BILA|nr:hypothetical protein Y032_0056g2690 [Ancylostoma ceylanicum]